MLINFPSCFLISSGRIAKLPQQGGFWRQKPIMLNTSYYTVTSTDINGVDYQHGVLLTLTEARSRIVNGRLLSKAEADARDYGKLWEKFKAMDRYGPTMGRMPTEKENELLDYKRQNNIV
jgi:hypothetical protein